MGYKSNNANIKIVRQINKLSKYLSHPLHRIKPPNNFALRQPPSQPIQHPAHCCTHQQIIVHQVPGSLIPRPIRHPLSSMLALSTSTSPAPPSPSDTLSSRNGMTTAASRLNKYLFELRREWVSTNLPHL